MVSLFLALMTLSATDEPAELPLANRPYHVKIFLGFEDHPRLPAHFQSSVRHELETLTGRLMGNAWNTDFHVMPSEFRSSPVPPVEFLASHTTGVDKVFWLMVHAGSEPGTAGRSPIQVTAREYDVEFGEWGPVGRRQCPSSQELARTIFELAYRQFRPIAIFPGRTSGNKVEATMQGLALQPKGATVALASMGTPFRVFREFYSQGERISRDEIPWTYLVYRGTDDYGLLARFEVVSGLRGPLSARTRRKSRIIAIACGNRDDAFTSVRFVAGKEDRPIVGYQVTVKPQDQSAEVTLGNTDHDGRISIRPVFLSNERPDPLRHPRVLEVSLLSGRLVLSRFPLVPGEKTELTVRARIDPLLTDVNGRILALQDEVVDVVARRTLLQKQLTRLAEKQDAQGAKAIGEKINRLPDKAHFEAKIEEIKASAEAKGKQENRPNLGSNINRLFLQTENLVASYFQADKVTVEIDETPAPDPGNPSASTPGDGEMETDPNTPEG